MPKIPEISYQTRPAGPQQQTRMSPEAAGAGVASAVKQLGGAVAGAAGAVFEKHRRQALFEAELQALENEKTVLDAFEKAKQEAPEGADGFTEDVEQRFDAWMPQAMEQAPATNEAQQALQTRTLGLRNRVLTYARDFQARSKAALDVRRATEAQDSLVNHARAAPHDRDGVLTRHKEFIASAPFPNEQARAKALADGEHRILAGALDGLVRGYEINPRPAEEVDAAIAALKAGELGYKKRVTPAVFDDALTRLENRKKALETESRALYGKDMADTLAAIAVNGPSADSGDITLERALEVRKDAKLAKRDVQQIEEAKKQYNLQQTISTTSAAEDQRVWSAAKKGVEGVGAEYKAQNLTKLEQAMRDKWRAYSEDQVAYIYRTHPGVAEMAQKAEAVQDPRLREDATAALKQAQIAMGTPTWAVQIVGKGGARQIADKLNALPAESAADQIEALQQRYKKDWTLVMRELEEAKVTPGLLVLGRLNTLEDVGLRKQLAGFMQVGKTEMRRNIGDTTASDIDAKIDKQIPVFAATMFHAGRTGQDVVKREREAMSVLAYGLAQTGMSANDAAVEAFNLLLGNRYDFGATFRTPKGELGFVERATDIELRQIKPEDLMPPALGPYADSRLSTEEAMPSLQRAAYDVAVNQGIWVNNQDGSGLIRLAPDAAGSYAPVRLADGRQWEVLFADVRVNPPTALTATGTPFTTQRYLRE